MWPIGELLSAFRFSTRIRKAIEGYYEWQRATSMSVRQLFEIFVSDTPPPKPGIVITPFLSLRNAGTDSFWWAIDRISELDLGQTTNLQIQSQFHRA